MAFSAAIVATLASSEQGVQRNHRFRLINVFHRFVRAERGPGYVVLKGHISVTISYLSHWLTTETINYINENSFIENLAKLKYSMWAQRGKQM